MESLGSIVTMEVTNIGTQGYPGTGKTSILDLALGKEPVLTRNSTGCADPPSYYLMIKGDNSWEVEWEHVTTDKMFELLSGAVKKAIDEHLTDENKYHSSSIAEPSDNPCGVVVSKPNLVPKSSTHSTLDAENQAILPDNGSAQTPADTIQQDPSILSQPYSIFPELLRQLHNAKISDTIFNAKWLMVTDCGGQPPFLDAAALFLRNSCLQIFSVKLDEPLDEKPKFSYFINGKSASFVDSCLQRTNIQAIETFAKSVAAIQPPYTPSAKESPKGVKFAVVGTFNDKAHECNESVRKKEDRLNELLRPHKSSLVRYKDRIILPVNAITTDKMERQQAARSIQQLITRASGVTLRVDVKLRWFGFLLSLLTLAEKDEKAILKLSECIGIGSRLGMDESETRKAVRYFHDVGVIMHFESPELEHLVIVNAKPLLDNVSRLISFSFLDDQFLVDHCDIVLPSGTKEHLQLHGRFNQDLLEKCLKFTEPMTSRVFLEILEHVKVVAVIDRNECEYFMPCGLEYATEEQCVPHSSFPWVIRFRIKQGTNHVFIPLPVGYLPALIVILLTQFPSEFSTDRDSRQYRYVINLKYKTGKGKVYFVERHLHLEVYFTSSEWFPFECMIVRERVLEAMHLTEERLRITKGYITKVDSFICCCGGDRDRHFGEYIPELQDAMCEMTNKPCNLNSQCSLWIPLGKTNMCCTCTYNNGTKTIMICTDKESKPVNSLKRTATVASLDSSSTSPVKCSTVSSIYS